MDIMHSNSLDSGRWGAKSHFWKKYLKKRYRIKKSIYSSSKVLEISELFCLYVKRSKTMSFLEILILGHPIPLFLKMTWHFKLNTKNPLWTWDFNLKYQVIFENRGMGWPKIRISRKDIIFERFTYRQKSSEIFKTFDEE